MEIESNYLNEESCQDGDIIEIVGEGSVEVKVSQRDGDKYKVHNFPVSNGRYELVYTPSAEALKLLIKQYGRETKNWIHKKFQVKFAEKIVFGQPKKVILPQFLEVKA